MSAKRPKPVLPWLYALTAFMNTVVAVLYVVQERWGYGVVWAVLAVLWAAMVPVTLKTHRLDVEVWETMQRTRRILDRLGVS